MSAKRTEVGHPSSVLGVRDYDICLRQTKIPSVPKWRDELYFQNAGWKAKTKVSATWFLPGPHSLACGGPFSLHVLTWPFFLQVSSSFNRDTSPIGLRSTFMTFRNYNYLLKDPHLQVTCWLWWGVRVRTATYEWGGVWRRGHNLAHNRPSKELGLWLGYPPRWRYKGGTAGIC